MIEEEDVGGLCSKLRTSLNLAEQFLNSLSLLLLFCIVCIIVLIVFIAIEILNNLIHPPSSIISLSLKGFSVYF